ncbi:hypothetical protein Pla108_22850 [Botrimarina colliarenosi]|uniref:PDZ domain-containing protein n=1 Tax=Botrimarina colliarenosi TaxID=2528001 RepID=A0A5C6AFP4_9BACT|nr:hypothetical protein [Botrimarina colliarenosi]TWT98128.1 hypothetical protein Pla108_22850 [Botrimarina colliarenosi]
MRFVLSAALVGAVAVAASMQGAEAQQSAPMQQGAPMRQQMQIPAGQQPVANMASHYSQRLKAKFVLQQMQIPNFTFWGARIVGMDPDSPLHQIGLQLGDVVTRLDGTRINTGKWWDGNNQVWVLPQMERHYGRTEIRIIRSGTTVVRNEFADLGSQWQIPPSFPGGGGGGIIVP